MSPVHDLPAHPDPAAAYDGMNRKIPQRLGFMAFARGVHGYAAQFDREVPGSFFVQVADGVMEVSCPCGETPRLRWLAPVVCGCQRTFVSTGSRVLVARSRVD